MTKKHFEAMAAEISKIESKRARKLAAEAMARVCFAENPRFDAQRFRAACGL